MAFKYKESVSGGNETILLSEVGKTSTPKPCGLDSFISPHSQICYYMKFGSRKALSTMLNNPLEKSCFYGRLLQI